MIGRILATCGWVAHQAGRPFRAGPLRALGRAPVVALGLLLVVLAALPFILPQLEPQPQDVTVQQIFDGEVTHPDGWVRLRGGIFPLADSPTGTDGEFALLVDAANTLRAIVISSDDPVAGAPSAARTGHLVAATVVVEEELPIEATVAGTRPRIVPDRLVELDAVTTPVRSVLWPLSIVPVLLGVVLLIGARTGYPIFRPSTDVDVLAGPLGAGERVPAAYAGRIGPNVRELADPGGVLLLVRRGPHGNLLTAQPLADDDGPAPAPVSIGGSWTAGRLGDVYTISETVPALVVRSELVDAIFLFARTAERDRVAALVSVDR
ncbi:MAG: hypothetical protein ACRDGD_04855 [Candidatus Limnocylindria bacterium]